MKSYVINFIRHGMTEANVKGQYAGVTDVKVCTEGIEKLEKLKRECVYPKVDACYSSPLTRCIQTCKVIYPDAEPTVIDDLRECDFGEWEGKTPEDLKGNEDYEEWLKSGQKTKPPGGESGVEFEQRICGAVEKLVEDLMRSGTTSASVFAHGGVILVIMMKFGIERSDPYKFIVANGCGFSVRITPGIWMRDKVFEICEKIPFGHKEQIFGKFKKLLDEQREAIEI